MVYADTDELGTYCIMDLEQWLYDLGVSIEEVVAESNLQAFQYNVEKDPLQDRDKIPSEYVPLTLNELEEKINQFTEESTNNHMRVMNEGPKLRNVNKQVDLVFVVDTTGSMGNAINNVKTYIGALVTSLYQEGITPYVAVVDYTDYRNYPSKSTITLTKKDGGVWAYNKDEAIQLINQLQLKSYGYDETPIDALETARRLNFRSGSTKFMVLITDEGYYVNNRYGISSLNQMAQLLKNGGSSYNNKSIITSVVTSSSLKNTYTTLNNTTDGGHFNIYSNFSPQLKVKDFISTFIQQKQGFSIISGAGLSSITLDAPLAKGGSTDTDDDGLTDSEEVNWSMLTINADEIKYPTLEECMNKKKGYVVSGLNRLDSYVLNHIKQMRVLPILSDPTKKDSDGDGILDKDDYRRLYYDKTKTLIFQSKKLMGKDANGNTAADMLTDDYSKDELMNLHPYFKYQIDEADKPDVLFSEFEDMSTSLFARGEMEDVILDMINHFKDGTGTDYNNDILTENAGEHKTTQEYIEAVKKQVIKELVKNVGNLEALTFYSYRKDQHSIYNYVQNNLTLPKFNTPGDIVGGLTICVNDTWGNYIEVDNYEFDGKYFKGTLRFNIYDHFGLDEPDVLPRKQWWKNYGDLAGFRAWFTLQHYDKFNGEYKPFITRMVIEVPFQGQIVCFEPAVQ